MANNREISQFAGLVTVNDTTNAVTIGSTLSISGDLDVNSGGVYCDATNNRLGIGTAGPDSPLTITKDAEVGIKIRSADTNYSSLLFGVDTGNGFNFITSSNSGSGTIRPIAFRIGISEAVRIDSDGVKFNGDTAAANALDDYEEGTFTPTYSDESGNSSNTVVRAYGNYVKVGKMVNCYGSFYQSGSPTGMVGTDALRISGLPFTNSSTAISVGSITSLHSAYRQPTVRFTKVRLSSNANFLIVLRDNGSPNLATGTNNWEIPALVDSIDSVGANNCAVSFNITYRID